MSRTAKPSSCAFRGMVLALVSLAAPACGRVSFVARDAGQDARASVDAAASLDASLPPTMDAASLDATSLDAASLDAASLDAASFDAASLTADAVTTLDAAATPDAVTSPDAASGPVRVVAIAVDANVFAADRSFSCALQSDGRVACWGGNDRGQLGDGTTTDHATPAAVTGLTDAVALGSGSEHACALRASGALVCWGANDLGQLGDGSTTDRSSPVTVTATAGADVVAIAGSLQSTCVLRGSGTVQCWGQRTWTSAGGVAASAETLWASGVDAIEAAGLTIFAMGASGLAYVGQPGWGYPTGGPLTVPADGTGTTSLDAIDAAAGWDHSCAVVRDGTVRCFGRDEGKAGDGTPGDTQENPPVTVLGVSDAVSIAAGAWHTCAAQGSGRIMCWGSNSNGELGDGGPTGLSRLATTVSGIDDALALDVGWVHSCALRADGTVWCWGGNNRGQLGTGDFSPRTTPAPVVGLPLP